MFKGQKITPEHNKVYRYETGERHKYLGHFYTPVSYTHLTLPTICSV